MAVTLAQWVSPFNIPNSNHSKESSLLNKLEKGGITRLFYALI